MYNVNEPGSYSMHCERTLITWWLQRAHADTGVRRRGNCPALSLTTAQLLQQLAAQTQSLIAHRCRATSRLAA